LNFEGESERMDTDSIIKEILESTPHVNERHLRAV
jgi:hypothetical protein